MSTREIKRAIKRILKDNEKAGNSTLVNLSAESWKEDDQQWFLDNSSRSFRIRRLFALELPEESNNEFTHVLVRQLIPGVREKLFLYNPTKGSAGFDALPDTDTIGMLLWEKVNNGSTAVSLNDIVRAAKLIGASGGSVQ